MNDSIKNQLGDLFDIKPDIPPELEDKLLSLPYEAIDWQSMRNNKKRRCMAMCLKYKESKGERVDPTYWQYL